MFKMDQPLKRSTWPWQPLQCKKVQTSYVGRHCKPSVELPRAWCVLQRLDAANPVYHISNIQSTARSIALVFRHTIRFNSTTSPLNLVHITRSHINSAEG